MSRTTWISAVVMLFAWLAVIPSVHAIDRERAFEDPAMQERYERLTRELRCLQCRSEPIADSNASLAMDLRRQVRELIAEGKSDTEILQFMQERYGDYVLYKPPVAPRTWLLWGAPILFVLAGAISAGVIILRKGRLPEDDPSDPGLGAS